MTLGGKGKECCFIFLDNKFPIFRIDVLPSGSGGPRVGVLLECLIVKIKYINITETAGRFTGHSALITADITKKVRHLMRHAQSPRQFHVFEVTHFEIQCLPHTMRAYVMRVSQDLKHSVSLM
jgi:hypothetical protein